MSQENEKSRDAGNIHGSIEEQTITENTSGKTEGQALFVIRGNKHRSSRQSINRIPGGMYIWPR